MAAGLGLPASTASPAPGSDGTPRDASQPVEQETPRSEDTATPQEGVKGHTITQEPTRIQQVIARRMAEAKATVPDFQVQSEVVLDPLLELRAPLKAYGAGAAQFLSRIRELLEQPLRLAL
jgi:pyruvate dehydrogenase E2 component (dihydrolipoamide acetyltransferase)